MAVGAILPPLFFERRALRVFAPGIAFSGTPRKQISVGRAVERQASISPAPMMGRC
ncbi:hypothetical protein V1281_005366 [Nitrobacteraceae bacterium AZCC 2161]